MKLLLEKWNKFLLEDRAQGAYVFQTAIERKKADIDYELRDGDLAWAIKNKAQEIVNNCPPLQKDYVKDVIGVGSRGIVFSLESGRVLKLYLSGYLSDRSGSQEAGFYKSSQKDIFSGRGKRTTLPVFDSGSFEILSKSIRNPHQGMMKLKINYAVMSEMITLEDYFQKRETYRMVPGSVDLDDVSSLLEFIKELVNLDTSAEAIADEVRSFIKTERAWNKREPTKKEITDFIEDVRNKRETDKEDALEYIQRIAKRDGVQDYELKNLISTVYDVYKKYGKDYLNDLHGGNVGVDLGTVRTKDPKFILFDP